jgi:hypothetical protein
MAQWKKVVVSGSTANLANLQVDGLSSGLVTGNSGNLTTTAVNGSGNILATTGASGLSVSGSFSGSFQGDGSSLSGITATQLANSLTDGNGIADFTFDGSGAVSISVELDGSTLANGASGIKINDGGVDTTQLATDAVTADKLDDVFTDGGGVAGTFGSTTQIPSLTIDGQGRITTASLVSVSSTLNIAGDSGTDGVSLISDTLTFAGTDGLDVAITDNTVTIGAGGNLISSSAQVDGASITNNTVSFGGVSVALNGTDATPAFDLSDATAYPGDSSLTTVGTVTSGDVSAILPSGVVSGSVTSPSQGTLRVNGADIDLGLQSGDSPTFSALTVSNNAVIQGDLVVQGTTTTLQTTNTAITDKFILLNSGSANPDEGGLVIDEGSGTGHAFIYDSSDGRFGVNQSVSSTATTANSEAYLSLVIDEDNVAHDITDAEYHKRGNIKIDSSDDIFIYT